MAIFKLRPAFKDYLWGGARLKEEYGKDCDSEKVAESWELSCHRDGECRIAEGRSAGLTLREYIQRAGKDTLGSNCQRFEDFPILIKLIDARDDLSVQVHPNDGYARRVEGEWGKVELWYVADCDEGAEVLFGFDRRIGKEEFARRIADNTLLEVVDHVKVHKGDVFFIKAGTLHAIGKGVLMAEIQQSSNITYRIYDYGRVGVDGKPRELHIEKAMAVTRLSPAEQYPSPPERAENGAVYKLLASCEYFTSYRVDVAERAELTADESSFVSLLLLEGEAAISAEEKVAAKKGDSVFISAGTGRYTVEGRCSFILTRIDEG